MCTFSHRTYSDILFGSGESGDSLFNLHNLSNTARAAACLASFFDFPVPIAETIGSASINQYLSYITYMVLNLSI